MTENEAPEIFAHLGMVTIPANRHTLPTRAFPRPAASYPTTQLRLTPARTPGAMGALDRPEVQLLSGRTRPSTHHQSCHTPAQFLPPYQHTSIVTARPPLHSTTARLPTVTNDRSLRTRSPFRSAVTKTGGRRDPYLTGSYAPTQHFTLTAPHYTIYTPNTAPPMQP